VLAAYDKQMYNWKLYKLQHKHTQKVQRVEKAALPPESFVTRNSLSTSFRIQQVRMYMLHV